MDLFINIASFIPISMYTHMESWHKIC